MKIEVSNGELLDKVTILQIKLANITDSDKLSNVKQEFDELYPYANAIVEEYGLQTQFNQLHQINNTLWNVEDSIREKERLKEFDATFVELARNVYFTNDKRAHVKKQINLLSKSTLVEEKSYEAY